MGRAVSPRVDLHASTGASCSRTSATSRSHIAATARSLARRRRPAGCALPGPRPRAGRAARCRGRASRAVLGARAPLLAGLERGASTGLSRFSFMGDGVGSARGVRDLRRLGGHRDGRARRQAAALERSRSSTTSTSSCAPAPCPRPRGCRLTSTSATSAASATSSRRRRAARRRTAPTTPDAALLFADRMLAIDHREGSCYLLALSRDGDDADAVAWLDETSRLLRALPDPRPRDGALAAGTPPLIGMTDPGARTVMRPRHDKAAYLERIAACIEQIYEGESYEICLTNTVTARAEIDPAGDLLVAAPDQPGAVRRAARVPRRRDPLRVARALPVGRHRRRRRVQADQGHPAARRRPGRGRGAAPRPREPREGPRREPHDRRPHPQRPQHRLRDRLGARPQAVRRRDLRAGPPARVDRARHAAPGGVGGRMRACDVPRRVDDRGPEDPHDADHRPARGGPARVLLGRARLVLAQRRRRPQHRHPHAHRSRRRGDLRRRRRDRGAVRRRRGVRGDGRQVARHGHGDRWPPSATAPGCTAGVGR